MVRSNGRKYHAQLLGGYHIVFIFFNNLFNSIQHLTFENFLMNQQSWPQDFDLFSPVMYEIRIQFNIFILVSSFSRCLLSLGDANSSGKNAISVRTMWFYLEILPGLVKNHSRWSRRIHQWFDDNQKYLVQKLLMYLSLPQYFVDCDQT